MYNLFTDLENKTGESIFLFKFLFTLHVLVISCSSEDLCVPVYDFVCCASELECFKDIEVFHLLLW